MAMSSDLTLRGLLGLGDEPAALRDSALIMIDCQNTYRRGVMQLEGAEDASSWYRYAVAWEIPEPWPSRRMSGRSRNQASAKTACCQQVRARVPFRVPISRR
jgi:hypothetical protein